MGVRDRAEYALKEESDENSNDFALPQTDWEFRFKKYSLTFISRNIIHHMNLPSNF